MNTDTLKMCYDGLKGIVGNDIEPFEIVNEVEEYRQFWKPKDVKVVLLAESHIFSKEREFKCQLKRSNLNLELYPNLKSYPKNFVRFVYCLAYGENDLLENEAGVKKNSGSWQFWKILYSCLHKTESKEDFAPILKSGTQNFNNRINNKIQLLKILKECGIWLVDASIVGLYRSRAYSSRGYKKLQKDIISCCWNNHTNYVLENADPEFVICVGKGVGKIIEKFLYKKPFNGRFEILPQPQARLKKSDAEKVFQTYFKICNKYCCNKTKKN